MVFKKEDIVKIFVLGETTNWLTFDMIWCCFIYAVNQGSSVVKAGYFHKHNVPVLKFTETLKNDKNYVWQIVTTSTTLLFKNIF